MKNKLLFNNKYRIPSTRIPDWDYSNKGYYFVTICAKDHECFFGKIKDEKMVLSEIGEIAEKEWNITKKIRQGVLLDEYIIMPNHIHGIMILESGIDNLSAIIRGYKSAVTKKVKELGNESFQWQTRFYEHVIRTDKSLNAIREYIANNIIKWELDDYHPKNLKK